MTFACVCIYSPLIYFVRKIRLVDLDILTAFKNSGVFQKFVRKSVPKVIVFDHIFLKQQRADAFHNKIWLIMSATRM